MTASPATPSARVRVRHRLGAGYAEPAFGVAFYDDAVATVDPETAAAMVAQAPETFTLEAETAGKEQS